MKKVNSITVYDEKIMYVFLDGGLYVIDTIRAYPGENSENQDLPEEAIEKFATVVEKFQSPYKFKLVYNEKYKYYNIAILGYNAENFKWTDEFNELEKRFSKHLKDHRITFH